MSVIPPGLSRLLQFYLSGPLPCPYLPGKVERKLFTRLTGDETMDIEINATLTRAGFRRSHDIVYRPACSECNACVPVRIPVHSFKPSRSLRRIAAANSDLSLEIIPTEATNELYDLFMAYQSVRHPDSDMARMSFGDFSHMLHEGESATHIYQLRAQSGTLMGAILTTGLKQSGSSAEQKDLTVTNGPGKFWERFQRFPAMRTRRVGAIRSPNLIRKSAKSVVFEQRRARGTGRSVGVGPVSRR